MEGEIVTETRVGPPGTTKEQETRAGIWTEVVTEAEGFAALEEEWGELYGACPAATPFQSWAWLYSWWEHYGGGRELRIVTVRDGYLLVGLLPFVLERPWGLPGRLLFAGTGPTDYMDLLAREGWKEVVVEAGLVAIGRMGGWAVADLQEIRSEAPALALEAGWSGPKTALHQSSCPFSDVEPWDEMLRRLKPKRRSSARQAIRRAREDGLVPTTLAGAGEAGRAARRLVALHRESWQGRGIGVEHTSPRFEAFMEAVVGRMTERGLGVISEFRRDGEAVVSHFLILGRDFVGGYMIGADSEAIRRYQFSSLCMWDEANVARDRGLSRVDDLRGEESYKLRWSSGVSHNRRVILARNRAVLAAYNGYLGLRSKAETFADSEEAPRWVTSAVMGYRNLRTKASRHIERRSG